MRSSGTGASLVPAPQSLQSSTPARRQSPITANTRYTQTPTSKPMQPSQPKPQTTQARPKPQAVSKAPIILPKSPIIEKIIPREESAGPRLASVQKTNAIGNTQPAPSKTNQPTKVTPPVSTQQDGTLKSTRESLKRISDMRRRKDISENEHQIFRDKAIQDSLLSKSSNVKQLFHLDDLKKDITEDEYERFKAGLTQDTQESLVYNKSKQEEEKKEKEKQKQKQKEKEKEQQKKKRVADAPPLTEPTAKKAKTQTVLRPRTHQRYSPQVKAASLEALKVERKANNPKAVETVAKKYGVNVNTLHGWDQRERTRLADIEYASKTQAVAPKPPRVTTISQTAPKQPQTTRPTPPLSSPSNRLDPEKERPPLPPSSSKIRPALPPPSNVPNKPTLQKARPTPSPLDFPMRVEPRIPPASMRSIPLAPIPVVTVPTPAPLRHNNFWSNAPSATLQFGTPIKTEPGLPDDLDVNLPPPESGGVLSKPYNNRNTADPHAPSSITMETIDVDEEIDIFNWLRKDFTCDEEETPMVEDDEDTAFPEDAESTDF